MVLVRRLSLLLLLAACASACRGTRGDTLLFSLEDPRGDDHGDGELRYPLRQDLGPGSLDLLSLRAYAESGGTRFEATFARSIPRPQTRTVDAAGTTQADVARFGFYTFNLDVYVDQDGTEGSGRTDTLPGRHLTLAPGSAWEKVLVLTPRPYEAREALRKLWREAALVEAQRQGALSESAVRALEAQVVRQLEERVFFATRIRVTGATISFFVPEGFLGGQAQPTWGYAVAVTGSTLDRRVELPALFGGVTAPAAQGLMVLGIGPGVSPERFGGGRVGGSTPQSPVVDLMVPEGVRQEEVLGPQAPGWPAVVPASPALPQAPDAGGVSGQGDAPGATTPRE
jgi:C-terminal binding-module, SLH-like, of glucodextranase